VHINALLIKAKNRKASKFRTLQERSLLVEMKDAGDVTLHQSYSHGTAIEYFMECIAPFEDLKCMSWATLRKSHTWEDIHKSAEFMIKKKIFISESVDKTGLFDEYCCFKIHQEET
jgi:hypothetical protein